MTIKKERTNISGMNIPEGNEFAQYRLEQLEFLLNKEMDRPVVWTELKVVRKRNFYGRSTYENESVPCQADSAFVEKIREYGIFSFRQDLIAMGCQTQADKILESYPPPASESNLR